MPPATQATRSIHFSSGAYWIIRIIRLIILVEWFIDILKFAAPFNGLLHSQVVFNSTLLLGAPIDCFLQNICSEKQMLPRIFFDLRTAKNF